MSFFGIPRGRRKVAAIWMTIDAAAGPNNATLYINDSAPTTVTYDTTGWLELVATSAQTINNIEIFDSTGFSARLAIGAASSEETQFFITLGGNGNIPVRIDAGNRIAIKPEVLPPLGAELMINFYD